MVLQCTTTKQSVREFTEQVGLIWEQWFAEFRQITDLQKVELVRKERLTTLRIQFLDLLDQEVIAQIMRDEAAKYNNVRSK